MRKSLKKKKKRSGVPRVRGGSWKRVTGDVGSVVVAVAAAVVVEVYDLVVETVAVGIESVVGRIVVDAVGREIDCLDLRLQGSCCGLELMASCSMNPTRKTDPFLPLSLMTLSLCLCMFVLISEEEERQVMPPMDRRRNAMLSGARGCIEWLRRSTARVTRACF